MSTSQVLSIPLVTILTYLSRPQDVSELQEYLLIHQMLQTRSLFLAKKLQVIFGNARKGRVDNAIPAITVELSGFFANIASHGLGTVSTEHDLHRTCFSAANEQKFAEEFLVRAVASHLQTAGVTVVIGRSAEDVNMLIDTLATFLPADQLRQSRYGASVSEAWYAPDLFLQGLVLTADEEFNPELLSQSQRPSTVVDVEHERVLQTKSKSRFEVMRHDNEQDELASLNFGEGASVDSTSGIGGGTLLSSPRTTSSKAQASGKSSKGGELRVFTARSALVATMFGQVMAHKSSQLRQLHLSHFPLQLARKADIILAYVDAVGASAMRPMNESETKDLKDLLGVQLSVDFHILLAAVDRLEPDTSVRVLGDPMMQQERFVGLLGMF